MERVEVGDAHRVRDDRAGRGAAAGADRDAVVLGPHDEVGDDEEVAREPHLDDDVHLVLGLLLAVVAGRRRDSGASMPRRTSSWNQVTSVYALGDVELRHEVRRSRTCPSVSTRSATRRVLRQPSCQASEESMAYISSVDFR